LLGVVALMASEQLYKKCASCQQLYPGVIGDIHDRCPKHAEHFDSGTISRIKRTRSIPADVYDMWWKDPAGEYHRACRGCGKHLLKKNGTPMSDRNQRRWCSPGCYHLVPMPNWGQTVYQLLKSRPAQQPDAHEYLSKVQCDRCGEWVRRDRVEIHHVRPVITLTEADLKLIWDFSNLMVLCHGCHNGDMHEDVYHFQALERAKLVKQEIKSPYKMRLF